jgi:hypothetical protein
LDNALARMDALAANQVPQDVIDQLKSDLAPLQHIRAEVDRLAADPNTAIPQGGGGIDMPAEVPAAPTPIEPAPNTDASVAPTEPAPSGQPDVAAPRPSEPVPSDNTTPADVVPPSDVPSADPNTPQQ